MRADRVLVVTDEMEVGGSQRQIVHLLRGLRAQGRKAALLYFRKRSHLVDQLEAEGVDVHRIDKRGAFDPRFVLALVRFLRAGDYDVIHAFSITAEMWVRLVMPLVRGTRLVSSIRGLGLSGPAWHWRAKRWVLGGSSAVISNSRAGAELVAQRCGVAAAGIAVVPNGVELPPPPGAVAKAEARKKIGLAPEAVLLLFVGRLVPEKDLSLLIDAMARIPAERRPLLWLAGEGPERARIEATVAAAGMVDTVRLLGERADTAALMTAADLLVLPSKEEGLSNVLLEGMGAGLPVIATAVGGSPEIVEDGVNGRLLPSGDARALADAINALTHDAEARHRLGHAARRHAESRYAISAMVEATADIYDRCVQGVEADA